jgi:hypothetical protein
VNGSTPETALLPSHHILGEEFTEWNDDSPNANSHPGHTSPGEFRQDEAAHHPL